MLGVLFENSLSRWREVDVFPLDKLLFNKLSSRVRPVQH